MADGSQLQAATNAPVLPIRPSKPPGTLLEITIHDLWRKILGRSDFGIEDRFNELSGSRAQAERMLAETEDLIRRPIPQGAWRRQLTIRNLSKAISKEAARDSRLVTLAKEGTGTPLFYCHGDLTSSGFYALTMAARLGGERAVYLLNPPFKPNQTIPLKEMVTPFVDEIERLWPKGKIELAGFCNGGVMAWEIANQLLARGRELDRLILVDAVTLNARPSYRAAARLFWLAGFGRTELMSELWVWPDVWIGRVDAAKRLVAILTRRSPSLESRLPSVYHPALHALSPYLLPRLPLHVDFVVASECAGKLAQQTHPLRRFVRSVSRHVVPGRHETCVTTHVDALADILRGILDSPPPPRLG